MNKFEKLGELIVFSGIETKNFEIIKPIVIVGDDGNSLYVGTEELNDKELKEQLEEILNFPIIKEIGNFKIEQKINKGIGYFKVIEN